MSLGKGDVVPEFSLPDQSGRIIHIDADIDADLVLFFYQGDFLPVCLKHLRGLNRIYAGIQNRGARLYAISMDTVESHRRLSEKEGISFPLLADPDGSVCKRFGVYVMSKSMGRTYWGVQRTTFFIDRDMVVREVLKRTKAPSFPEQVLGILDRMIGKRAEAT